MITKFQLTPRSSNRKTGPIATIRSSSNSCPSTCPFNNGGGCYAAGGPEAIHWRKLDKSEKPEHQGWIGLSDQFRAAKLKPGTLLRLNTAGDLPHLPATGEILGNVVDLMRGIFEHHKVVPFTYTHHRQTEHNLAVIDRQNQSGFTVNLSCDTEERASMMQQRGFPAVVVVPADDDRKHWTDQDGTRFLTCPAQTGETTCDRCRLCAKSDRSVVVAFRAHGTKAKKISARLETAH